jgi:dTDP-4-dehydrorhamnose reductase
MKILVLGANGMAGHVISLYFIKQGYDVYTFTRRSFPYGINILGDATNFKEIANIIKVGNYDYIINCIGILNQFAEADSLLAKKINSDLPHFLADIISNLPTRLIQMSTDCVFLGNTGPYYENSIKDGTTVYDKTKAKGEIIDDKNLTFRNSIIGPDMKNNGIGLFNWFMKQGDTVNGYTKAMWTGVTTLTLAKAMDRAMQTGLTGLYNLVNSSSISKFELLQLFNKYFCNGNKQIVPFDGFVLDKTLINTRSDFDFIVPSYEQMIAEMCDWVKEYKEIYKYYYI